MRRTILRMPHKGERPVEGAISPDEEGRKRDDIIESTPKYMGGKPFVKMLLARYKTTGGQGGTSIN